MAATAITKPVAIMDDATVAVEPHVAALNGDPMSAGQAAAGTT
jgi:hypothetical protein